MCKCVTVLECDVTGEVCVCVRLWNVPVRGTHWSRREMGLGLPCEYQGHTTYLRQSHATIEGHTQAHIHTHIHTHTRTHTTIPA